MSGFSEAKSTNGLKQIKYVPGKLHSQKAKIGTLCGLGHMNPTVMRRRLCAATAMLRDRHPRHKKMPSIIF